MPKLEGTYYTQECLAEPLDYLELHVNRSGTLNLENITSASIIMDVDGAKKLRKALKKYIKSQEEN